MPSKNPPISLRLKPGVLELVDKCAAHHKLSRHAAIVALIEGHISLREDVTKVTGQTAKAPAKRDRSRWLLDVPVGPVARPPGAMLKGGGLHPAKKGK